MGDDCHRFGVTIVHDGVKVIEVLPRSPRYPWTTCPAAGAHLAQRMKGVPLADAATVENQRQHCTHMYDLFLLGATYAGDSEPLAYEIRVSDPVDGVQLAEIDRNGVLLLVWHVGKTDPGDGVAGGDFRALEAWSRTLPRDLQEAARMLRRGVLVSGGRHMDFPAGSPASEVSISGVCYTFQPERAAGALRVANTLRDFSGNLDVMLKA